MIGSPRVLRGSDPTPLHLWEACAANHLEKPHEGTFMKRIAALLVLISLAAVALGGCAPAAPSTTPGSTETSGTPRQAEDFMMVGKTKVFLDGGAVYSAADYPHAKMDGEPSDNKWFKPEKDQGIVDRIYPASDPKTFKFLATTISTVNPMTYYLFQKDGGTLNKVAANTGYKFALLEDDGDNKILPNVYLGYYDFAWLPMSQLPELWSGYESRQAELYRAGNDYVIVGAAVSGGDPLLVAPSVSSLKDLDGKTVGVMNPSFDTEAAFNEMLKKDGLSTESAGGTVKVLMSWPASILSDLTKGGFSAAFARSKYAKQLTSEFGFKELGNTSDVWDGAPPAIVLVVRRDIIERHPEIVQMVVQANYDAAKRANASDEWKKPALDLLTAYKNKYAGPPVNVRLPEAVDALANPTQLKGVYDYMMKCGYFKVPYDYEELVDQSFYDKVKK
jgi:ABC-type nitrate/sulfonate/bicarbonate transport system substrate-binding protein